MGQDQVEAEGVIGLPLLAGRALMVADAAACSQPPQSLPAGQINQSINQSVNQSVSQSINQSTACRVIGTKTGPTDCPTQT